MKYGIPLIPTILSLIVFTACTTHHDELPVVETPKPDVFATTDNQPIRIEVSSSGYTPKTIGVTVGQKVALEFHRTDGDNCGEKLVFPDLGIERDLPVGEKVVVEVIPEKSGEFKFTCGMDMFRGKLIVSQ
jgi:plastocyanin domain-containing protein